MLGQLYNFWTNRAIRFKFGTRIEDAPLSSPISRHTESITVNISRAQTIEDSVNLTCSQSSQSSKPIRLQTDIHYLCYLQNPGTYCCYDYIYPSLQHPPLCLAFDDQFGFQPTGSTTAALIHLIHSITTLLDTNPFVV